MMVTAMRGAGRFFERSLEILERLARGLPGIVEAPRDLVVSHYKLAALAVQEGDAATERRHAEACYRQICVMQQRGMPLDAASAQVLERLRARFGGSG